MVFFCACIAEVITLGGQGIQSDCIMSDLEKAMYEATQLLLKQGEAVMLEDEFKKMEILSRR